MGFIKVAFAKSSEIGSFAGDEIYEVVDNIGWLGVMVKGVFWVLVMFLVVIAAIALNQYFSKNKRIIYTCSKCGYSYKEEEWAKKCDSWCTRHGTCNLEINNILVRISFY